MPITHRPIPTLPLVPRATSIAKDIHRSYPTGRQEFSRAISGEPMEITISTTTQFPPNAMANMVTTLNANQPRESIQVPFQRRNDQTFICKITPEKPGLFSFWVRFSIDGGATWRHDPVPDAWVLVDPPQVDHLHVHAHPQCLGHDHPMVQKLIDIKAMGFNAVHLLPLTTLDTSLSPYSAKDLFYVDPSYVDFTAGTTGLQQLEAFVAAAKALDIRLCFDLVLNHVGIDSHIARKAPEWIMPDEANPDGLRRARYWSDKGWLPWNDLVLIDYEHPAQQIRADIHSYMTEYALFWAKFANDTNGFVRFDNLHSSDKRFVDSLTLAMREEYPNLAIIAEYFTDSGTLLDTIPKWNLSLILATPWDSRFVPQLREYLKYLHSISQSVRFFMPITSHDSGSPAQEFGAVESTIPRYVAAALLGTGATGITQGVEWGIKEKINFIGKQPPLIPPQPARFSDFIRRVNEILVTQPALRRGQNCEFLDKNHHAIIAAFRKDARPNKIGFLILCNFDIHYEHVFETDLSEFLPADHPIRCIDLLTNNEIPLAAPRISIVLPKCAALVLEFSAN